MNEQKRRLTQQADRTLTGAIAQKKKVSNQSSGFTDNRPESAEYGKIVASIRAKAGNIPLQRNVTLASAVIQRQINDGDYNAARNTLIAAGSNSAKASHPKHTQGRGSPDGHGIALLREARDEFRAADAGQAHLVAGMTQAHYDAIHAAAERMGITMW